MHSQFNNRCSKNWRSESGFGLLEYGVMAGLVAIALLLFLSFIGEKWDAAHATKQDSAPQEEVLLPKNR